MKNTLGGFRVKWNFSNWAKGKNTGGVGVLLFPRYKTQYFLT